MRLAGDYSWSEWRSYRDPPCHADVMTWRYCQHYWPFVRGIHEYFCACAQSMRDDVSLKRRLSSAGRIHKMITWIRRNSQRASTWNTQNSKCFFIASIIINKLLNKQSSCMWFQTPWPSHHCNGDHKALSHHDKTNPSVTKIHRVVDLPICLVHCFYNEVMCVAKYYAYRTHSHREISIAVMDGLASIWHHGICKHHGGDYHTLYIAVPDHDDVDRSTFIRSAPA